MGKKRHTQDKLWITYKELVQDWGGKDENSGSKKIFLKKLPFYCCSLSFLPFKDAYCLSDGTIFDIVNILPYIKKYKKNPITGKPLKASELIKLNFYKNQDDEYHCPITYKVFTDNSIIVAIKESGNVYSYEAYEELNKKPKHFKDLLTNQEFDVKNIIIIQDPNNPEKEIKEFDFIKNKEDLDFINKNAFSIDKKENFVNLSSNYMKLLDEYEENATEDQIKRSEVLNMINNKQNIQEEDERIKKIKKEYEELEQRIKILEKSTMDSVDSSMELKKNFNISPQCYLYHLQKCKNVSTHERFSEGKSSVSFTSTSMSTQYKNNLRSLTNDELRNKTYYHIIKSKQLKGYVRLNTNYGYLNLQIECDLAPKTSENFLELCESGYYNNLSFHRLVKGFVLQGGDPTATGSGGTSYYGKAFEDEFHPNLTHSCRGILSMANSGKHSNSSQFFITLKSSPHLDNKHSVFGQVVGNIKVLDDIESIGSDSKGKPKTDIKILSTEVFSNPFRNVISDLMIKDLYLPGEAHSQSQIISDRVDANLKKLNDIAAGDLENNSEVGKYLNRKRKYNVDYKCLALGSYNDPYVYDKPNKIKFTSCNKFEFSDW